jgi:anti-sigma-K factor RskA
MNIQHNHDLVDKLAAEYVLGTLKGSARRRFETMLRDSALLRRAVAEWQDRLHPMAEFAPEQQVPPQVWAAISKKLDLKTVAADGKTSFWRSLAANLGFWRGLSVTSTALAAILVAVLVTRQPESVVAAPTYVAMLADDKSRPIAVVTGNAKRGEMTVRIVTEQPVPEDKSLELWAVPKEGPPRSLGLIADSGSATMPMPADASPESIPVLAVTLEPKGGSGNPFAPTGPIVFKGAWVKI